jgi:hypothetical protein
MQQCMKYNVTFKIETIQRRMVGSDINGYELEEGIRRCF